MKQIQTHGPSKLRILGFIAAGLMLGFSSISAWAAPVGTPSGTSISNLATLSYTVGGVTQTNIGSSQAGNTSGAGTATAFVVDTKIDVLVAKQDGSRVTATNGQVAATPVPAAPAYLTYTVTNNSNLAQDFKLSATSLASGSADPFGSTSTFATAGCRIYIDAGGAPANQLQLATDSNVSYIQNLASGASQYVFVFCDTPLGATNGQTGVVGLTAEAAVVGGSNASPSASYTAAQLNNSIANTQAGVEIVGADVAGPLDAARDAKHSATDTYIIGAAIISVSKTVATLCDPINGDTTAGGNPKNIPGAIVRWSITISNSATAGASATLGSISDALDVGPAGNTVFDTLLVTGAGVPAASPAFATTTCSLATGTAESAGGNGFKMTFGGTSTRTPTPKYTANGATFVTPNVAVTYATGMPAGVFGINTYTAGELKPGESVTVSFNVQVK